MKHKVLLRISLMLIALFSLTSIGYSQAVCTGEDIQDMKMKQDYATFDPLNGNYDLNFKSIFGTYYYYSSYTTQNFPGGFSFCYDQRRYSQFEFTPNGMIAFKPVPSGSYTYPTYYYYASGYYHYIYSGGPAPNWSYLGIGNYCKNYLAVWGGMTGYYYYDQATAGYGMKVLGSAPNRVAVFEWSKASFHFNNTNELNAQIRLYESNNKIEYHYGKVRVGYTYYFDNYMPYVSGSYTYWYFYYIPMIAMIGKDGTPMSGPNDWVNVYPPNAADNTDWTTYRSSIHGRGMNWFNDGTDGGPLGPFPTVRKASVVNNSFAQEGVRLTFGKGDPQIVNSVPSAGNIFRKNEIYGGLGDTENKPAIWVQREAAMPTIKVLYRIYGPGLEKDGAINIYRAKDPTDGTFNVNPAPQPVGDSVKVDFSVGTGIAFGTGGTLDLRTQNSSIKPGEYYVDASLAITGIGTANYGLQKFNISLPYDIALFVYKPKAKEDKKYPMDYTPIEMEVRNFGINSVTSFEIFCIIYKDGVRVSDTLRSTWTNTTDSLKPTKSTVVQMQSFFPDEGVGDYEIVAWVNLINVTDGDYASNIIPRADEEDYLFAIVKEVDIRAIDIVQPTASKPVTVGRPMVPIARFTNKGVNDVDFDTVYFWVTNSSNQVIFRDTIINYVISAGVRYDTTTITTKKFFVAPVAGQYTITAKIVAPYDDNPASWKIVSASFTAEAGISGDITVGANGTYKSLQAAIEAMHQKGVGGHVRFLLSDRSYTIGDTIMPNMPALDLSAHIPGIGPNATVTFMPSPDRAVERGSATAGVTINVLTASGKGIVLGQNINPANPSAIVRYVSPSQKSKYANSAGYIIFNGGQNKSFRFVLTTPRSTELYFHNVFFLQQGAQNNQIKNCLFENNYKDGAGNKLEPHVYLPKVKTTGTQVLFMDNQYLPNTSYSAAIAMRAVAPLDESQTNSLYNLDTIPINNNLFEGNEISGFGYGFVDLGAGALLREQHNQWFRYYNYNNVFRNNIIKDVGRAGIFLGFTENEVIEGNRIYNVTGLGIETYMDHGSPLFPDAAGIMAGGDAEMGWYGFNNLDMVIKGNEISNVQSSWVAYGIKSEQCLIQYGQNNWFPNDKENTKVFNNIIWGMTAKENDASISRIGIRLFTERSSVTDVLVPKYQDYYTWDDRVFNNTIIMPDDGGPTTGALIGIAVQNGKATKIMNNAVAIVDSLIHASSPASALIFYQGILPSEVHGLESDRNAFWRPQPRNNDGAAIYGFVELNDKGEFIEPINPGSFDQNAYETIRQWRNWTGQDMNSVFGDFRDDLTLTGNTIQYLRVKSPRPLGSVLNDRGLRLHEYFNDNTSMYNYDLLGSERGANGQLYDIGAQEFEGRMFLSDIEFVMVSSPSAYQAGSGILNDAEHIMTTLPLQYKVILRNSGNLYQSGVKVRLSVRDLDVDSGLRYYDTVETDIVVAQSREVIFDIPNSLIRTFSDLEDAGFSPLVPSRYNPSMKPNVTPRYEFAIEVQSDEDNVNNYDSTIFRFYVRKSNNQLMLISGEYTNIDISDLSGPVRSADEFAGRLNYDRLSEAFEDIGWWPNLKRDVDHPGTLLDSFKIDVFDRLAWEPKAVDYRMYKYVFWSDRHDQDPGFNRNYINRYQQWDIAEFLEEGTSNNKRNLVIASQEAVRNLDFATTNPNYDDKSTKFVNDYLRSMMNGNGYAFGIGNDCHNKKLKGVAVGRDIVHFIARTGVSYTYDNGPTTVNDENPYIGSVNLFTEGEGLARASFIYPEATTNPNMQTSGIAVTALNRNMIYIGVDWRHLANVEEVLRTILDFYDKNGGTDVPVELSNFDAKANGNRVEVTWSTASEFNTAKFEVERAVITDGMKSGFVKIATKDAAGTSSIAKVYGPVVDRNVLNGNMYIYRLKMIDLDGKFEYSDEKLVEMGGAGFWLGEARPNPVIGDVVKFEITTGDRAIDVWLYDVNGRRIDVTPTINNGFMSIDLNMIQSGNYTMIVKSGDLMLTRQFQVTK